MKPYALLARVSTPKTGIIKKSRPRVLLAPEAWQNLFGGCAWIRLPQWQSPVKIAVQFSQTHKNFFLKEAVKNRYFQGATNVTEQNNESGLVKIETGLEAITKSTGAIMLIKSRNLLKTILQTMKKKNAQGGKDTVAPTETKLGMQQREVIKSTKKNALFKLRIIGKEKLRKLGNIQKIILKIIHFGINSIAQKSGLKSTKFLLTRQQTMLQFINETEVFAIAAVKRLPEKNLYSTTFYLCPVAVATPRKI
jgi:hypothetical protein